MCFEIAGQDVKSWICQCHKARICLKTFKQRYSGGRNLHFCDSQFTWIHKLTVMIHFNSIHCFLVSQKRFDSWFQFNYSVIEVNDSSMILSELCTLERIQLNSIIPWYTWYFFENAANTSPLNVCLISSQPTQQIRCKADSYLMLLALQKVALIFNKTNKNQSFTCVIVTT